MNPNRPLLALALATGGLIAALPAATVTMPIEEVRPGMRGVGLTVFEGTTRSEFTAEIIGVLENSFGPRRNLVLARLDGGPLAASGVIQGMSGSPVTIDGRLVGAVSYSLGSFPKETIAGITPIGEMLRDDTPGPGRASRAARAAPDLTLPLAADSLTGLLSTRLARPEPFAARPGDVDAAGLPAGAGASYGARLRPIATPLTLHGFTPAAFDRIASMFGPAGLAPVVGGTVAGGAAAQSDTPLQAGDAVGVGLMRGDLSMAGTGTVTLVEDGRVHAFGHPFYNLGPSRFPMTRAYVHTVLPSQLISSRVATVGETLGTIDQDRSSGISGSLGPGPRLVPVRITLDAPERRRSETFEFEVVDDAIFTPLLVYNAMLNTLFSHNRQQGAATYAVRGEVTLAGHPPVRFGETFAGNAATVLASAYVAGPLTALVDNGIEPVTVERVDVSVTARDGTRTAELERVWLDDPRPRPGRTVPLRLAVRARDGGVDMRTVMVDLPSSARGRVRLLVADGATLALEERRQAGLAARPASLRHLIDALNTARRNDRFYVQLRRADAGAVVNGRRLPSLPRSVLDVLGADRAGAGLARMSSAALREWEVPLDRVVSGARVLELDLGS